MMRIGHSMLMLGNEGLVHCNYFFWTFFLREVRFEDMVLREQPKFILISGIQASMTNC